MAPPPRCPSRWSQPAHGPHLRGISDPHAPCHPGSPPAARSSRLSPVLTQHCTSFVRFIFKRNSLFFLPCPCSGHLLGSTLVPAYGLHLLLLPSMVWPLASGAARSGSAHTCPALPFLSSAPHSAHASRSRVLPPTHTPEAHLTVSCPPRLLLRMPGVSCASRTSSPWPLPPANPHGRGPACEPPPRSPGKEPSGSWVAL